MNTREIEKIMSDSKNFAGVFPRDFLININMKPTSGIIVNTDSSKEKGEHWIAIFIGQDCKGEYFDPFGIPPLHEDFQKFLNKNCKNGWTYNSFTVQHQNSTSCGKFCIFYLKNKFKGETFIDIISKFSVNLKINEKLVNGISSVK